MFITLYGINNIGKTTQAKRIVELLKKEGKNPVYLKYPVYEIEPSGPFLDRVLRSSNEQHLSEEELQMWFVLNRHQFQPELQRWLKKGIWVIAEDYIGTGIAWGTAKGASLEWLEEINRYLIKEDIAILLDGKPKISAKENVHIHERNDVLMSKCQIVLRDLAKRYRWETLEVQDDWDETTKRLWEKISIRGLGL